MLGTSPLASLAAAIATLRASLAPAAGAALSDRSRRGFWGHSDWAGDGGDGPDGSELGVFAPGFPERPFVTDQNGIRWAVNLTTGARTVFLAASRVVPTGERGLRGVAFHPAYQSNGLVYSTRPSPTVVTIDFPLPLGVTPDHVSVITEWMVSPPGDLDDVIDLISGRVVLSIAQPQPDDTGGALHLRTPTTVPHIPGRRRRARRPGTWPQPPGQWSGPRQSPGRDAANPPRTGPIWPTGSTAFPQRIPFSQGAGSVRRPQRLPGWPMRGDLRLRLPQPLPIFVRLATGDLYVADVAQALCGGNRPRRPLGRGNYGWPVKEARLLLPERSRLRLRHRPPRPPPSNTRTEPVDAKHQKRIVAQMGLSQFNINNTRSDVAHF